MTSPQPPRGLDSPLLPKIFRYMSKGHVLLYRATGGRLGSKWRIGAGFRKPVPTLLLEHTGRKSGKTYVSPLVYIRDGADIVVVASQGGRPEHPQWYRNLVANPAASVQIGSQRHPVRAVTADPGERERLWPVLVEAYADFDNYQSWAEREIPVVLLKPACRQGVHDVGAGRVVRRHGRASIIQSTDSITLIISA